MKFKQIIQLSMVEMLTNNCRRVAAISMDVCCDPA
jgi:hypothetical protein